MNKTKIVDAALKIVFFAALFLSFVVGPKLTNADGGIFPIHGYTNETKQEVFIYYRNQTENLVISTSYQGNSSDFAWVIPTPTKPEVFKSDPKLFTALADITGTPDTSHVIYQGSGLSSGAAPSRSAIHVVEQRTIDIYDTAILQATDGEVLASWLAKNGYTFPKNNSGMLQDYIDKGWYFTVAKINNASLGADVTDALSSGTITPLRLSFQTAQIIYPMKLTRLAIDFAQANQFPPPDIISPEAGPHPVSPALSPNGIPITLYVLADTRTNQDSLTTDWANWVDAKTIQSINDSVGDPALVGPTQKLFLTRMSNQVDIERVNNDFVITKDSTNAVYPIPVYKTFGFWTDNAVAFLVTLLIGVLSPIVLIFIIVMLLQLFVIKKKWVYILGLAFEMLACLSALVVLFLAWMAAQSSASGSVFLQDGFIGVSLGLVLFFAAVSYGTARMMKEFKKAFPAQPERIK